MKILFLRHSLRNIGGTGVYTKLIIMELIKRGYTIGLWPSDGLVFDELKDTRIKHYLFNESKLIENHWDIIIIQNSSTFTKASEVLKKLKNVPIIFISHASSSEHQPIPFPNLVKVIKIAEGINVCDWGIPEEIVETHYNPVKVVNTKMRKLSYNKTKVLHISRLHPEKSNLIRILIQAINLDSQIELKIVGKGSEAFKLKNISNPNIEFLGETDDLDKLFKWSNIVVGSGRTVVEGLMFKRPVIVQGIRGLGGMVTPWNYASYRKIMFSGRVFGMANERISPFELLSNIKCVSQLKNLNEIVLKNFYLIQNDYSVSKVVDRFVNTINNVINLYSKISKKEFNNRYVVSLYSNIEIKVHNHRADIIRQPNNLKLVTLDKTQTQFLIDLLRYKNIHKYVTKVKKNYADLSSVYNNIYSLWNAHVLNIEERD